MWILTFHGKKLLAIGFSSFAMQMPSKWVEPGGVLCIMGGCLVGGTWVRLSMTLFYNQMAMPFFFPWEELAKTTFRPCKTYVEGTEPKRKRTGRQQQVESQLSTEKMHSNEVEHFALPYFFFFNFSKVLLLKGNGFRLFKRKNLDSRSL